MSIKEANFEVKKERQKKPSNGFKLEEVLTCTRKSKTLGWFNLRSEFSQAFPEIGTGAGSLLELSCAPHEEGPR